MLKLPRRLLSRGKALMSLNHLPEEEEDAREVFDLSRKRAGRDYPFQATCRTKPFAKRLFDKRVGWLASGLLNRIFA
jgi:hypothetical protein